MWGIFKLCSIHASVFGFPEFAAITVFNKSFATFRKKLHCSCTLTLSCTLILSLPKHVEKFPYLIFLIKTLWSGADPGFPVGGGADPLGGAPTYDFVKFSEKLHEIEKILGRRGARAGCAPLNLPLMMPSVKLLFLSKHNWRQTSFFYHVSCLFVKEKCSNGTHYIFTDYYIFNRGRKVKFSIVVKMMLGLKTS